jgi:hypothetical protein
MNPNETEDLDAWQERRARIKVEKKNGNGFGMPLGVAVRLWPTPAARDWRQGGHPADEARHLNDEIAKATGGSLLNADWEELLQGLPIGWTDPDVPNEALKEWPGWPSRPGQEQYPYEPPRTTSAAKGRNKRVEALGDLVPAQQLYPIFAAIMDAERGRRIDLQTRVGR